MVGLEPSLDRVSDASEFSSAEREAGRDKTAYRGYTVAMLDAALHAETPRIGLWLDSTDQTPQQTAAEILRRAPAEAALVPVTALTRPSGRPGA